MQNRSWIVEAGEFYALVSSQLESTDQVTRMSAECKWGMAKDAFAKATATAAFLDACYALEMA